jgi:hypothetical protein|uniref:Uncharacterized protein n=1 Tax=viral metagenome TaxID=1070528 RepID=A0A6C0JJ39_9ZZZZ
MLEESITLIPSYAMLLVIIGEIVTIQVTVDLPVHLGLRDTICLYTMDWEGMSKHIRIHDGGEMGSSMIGVQHMLIIIAPAAMV